MRSDERRARRESDFARYEWTGQQAADAFFRLHHDPAHGGTGSSGVVLPTNDYAVSRRPTAGYSVVHAYAHGLEYAEQVFGAGGVGLFFIAMFGPLVVLMFPMMWTVGGIIQSLTTATAVLFLWFFYRFDTVGYRYTPVLFNRALGKVHVFRDRTKFFSLWPLWGGGRYRIDTYDWVCVRGQISRFRLLTGPQAQDNAALGCIVLAAPDRAELVGEFPLGITASALAVQTLLDHWEHIRRYMEGEGPAFVQGEGPYRPPSTQTLLGALCFGQPFIGPGWRENAATADAGLVLWQVVALVLLPATAAFGLLRWVSAHVRSRPKWPAEVLASVGGAALQGAELARWNKPVAPRPDDEPTKEGKA